MTEAAVFGMYSKCPRCGVWRDDGAELCLDCMDEMDPVEYSTFVANLVEKAKKATAE